MIFIKTLHKILKQGLTLQIIVREATTKWKEKKGYWLNEIRLR